MPQKATHQVASGMGRTRNPFGPRESYAANKTAASRISRHAEKLGFLADMDRSGGSVSVYVNVYQTLRQKNDGTPALKIRVASHELPSYYDGSDIDVLAKDWKFAVDALGRFAAKHGVKPSGKLRTRAQKDIPPIDGRNWTKTLSAAREIQSEEGGEIIKLRKKDFFGNRYAVVPARENNPWYVGYRRGVAEVFWADSSAEVANLGKGFPEGWLGPYKTQKAAFAVARGGKRSNPDEVRFRGLPARVVSGLSLGEVRRHNPELATDVDAAGGVSVVSVDVGGDAREPAVLLMDGSLVPLDQVVSGQELLEPAFAVSEEFHGGAPRYAQGFDDQIEYSGTLVDLGLLIELGIYSTMGNGTAAETPLQFGKREGIRLATNPEKNQLFIVGTVGLTQRTLERLGIHAAEFDKERITIGPVIHMVYRTKKSLHHWKRTDYQHEMGEEGGIMPVLIYDRLNDQLELSGGSYQISERGILN